MKFSDLVYCIVKQIPAGKVATYKQIAILAGNPKASRAVGNALHNNKYPIIIPCHRVVNSKGEISERYAYGGGENQKNILKSEGISFIGENRVDLDKHKWEHTYYSFEKRTSS